MRRSRRSQRQPAVLAPAGAQERAALYQELGPVPLPLELGASGRNPRTYLFLVIIGFFLLIRVYGLTTRSSAATPLGWTTWSTLAAMYGLTILTFRHPVIRITEAGIDLRGPSARDVRHIPRDKVGCLLDHGPDRMLLRVIGEDEPVRLPTKALSARERFLLARCLTHYDLGQVFN